MVMYSVEGCIIRSVESLSLIGTSVDANTNVCLFVYMCIQINIHLYRKRINDEFLHSCLSNMYVEKKNVLLYYNTCGYANTYHRKNNTCIIHVRLCLTQITSLSCIYMYMYACITSLSRK